MSVVFVALLISSRLRARCAKEFIGFTIWLATKKLSAHTADRAVELQPLCLVLQLPVSPRRFLVFVPVHCRSQIAKTASLADRFAASYATL